MCARDLLHACLSLAAGRASFFAGSSSGRLRRQGHLHGGGTYMEDRGAAGNAVQVRNGSCLLCAELVLLKPACVGVSCGGQRGLLVWR